MFGQLEKLIENDKRVDRNDKELVASIVAQLENEHSVYVEISGQGYDAASKINEDRLYKKILRNTADLSKTKVKTDFQGNDYAEITSLYEHLIEKSLAGKDVLLNRYFAVMSKSNGATKFTVYDLFKYSWNVQIEKKNDGYYRRVGPIMVKVNGGGKQNGK